MKNYNNICNFKQFSLMGFLFTLLVGVSGWAQASVEAKKAEMKENVKQIVYSLDNVRNGLIAKDIMQLEGAAGGGLSVSVAAEIAERFQTAVELLKYIAMDKTMTQEEKRPMINDLGSAVGKVFIVVMRDHGFDELNPQDNRMHPAVKFAAQGAREFARTFTDVVRFEASANNEKVSRVKDRLMGELLGQEMIITLQQLIKTMGDIPDDRADDALRRMLVIEGNDPEKQGVAQMSLRVRESRQLGYAGAFTIMGGMAALWTIFPLDYVGTMSEYSEVTAKLSDYISFGVLGAMAIFKKSTASFATVPGLKRLISITKDPKAEGEFSRLKLPLMTRVLGLKKKLDLARQKVRCNVILELPSGKGTSDQKTP